MSVVRRNGSCYSNNYFLHKLQLKASYVQKQTFLSVWRLGTYPPLVFHAHVRCARSTRFEVPLIVSKIKGNQIKRGCYSHYD